ncbi:MAG: hypothetical protein GQ574_11465 [Crocinitomix sp.]|nr:hypothetical protein [Crocinitomix sp.]
MKINREKQVERLVETIKSHQELLKTKADLKELLESNEQLNTDSKILIINYLEVLTKVMQSLRQEALVNDAWEYFDDLL